MAALLKSASAKVRRFTFTQPRLVIGAGGLTLVIGVQLLVAVVPGKML